MPKFTSVTVNPSKRYLAKMNIHRNGSPQCTISDKIFVDFHSTVLGLFLLTTSESELDYYHQKVNIRVTVRVAEQLKT